MPTHKTILFGIDIVNIEQAARSLSNAIGFSLEARNSSYWGPYYTDHEYQELRLYYNDDPLYEPGAAPEDEKFFEPTFSEFPTLLYIDSPKEMVEQIEISMEKLDFINVLRCDTYQRDE